VTKVRTHGILIDRTPLKRNRVLTEEKLDDSGRRLGNSPRKSLRRLALQNGVSVSSVWTATKLLHIRSYKITVVSEIEPVDNEEKARFCNWFISRVYDGLPDPKLTFFTDEANFNLQGPGVVTIPVPQFNFPFTTKRQAYSMRLAQTVSLDRYCMKKLLMLNDAVTKRSIHFLLIWHLQKKDSVILCQAVLVHTQPRKLSQHYAVCLGNLMGRI
jgi:hypothetical protein